MLVVVFTSNHCPVATGYEKRIVAFARKYAGKKVGVVALNVGTDEVELLPAMKERAKSARLPVSVSVRPHAKDRPGLRRHRHPRVLRAEQGPRIAYMGDMDDDNRAAKVTAGYLAAVDALLRKATPARAETRARGCSLEYRK